MMKKLEIVDGPSKWDFVVAFFSGNNTSIRTVTFAIKDYGLLKFIVTGVRKENGNWDSGWFFEGQPLFQVEGSAIKRGFYSMETRKGWLEEERS